MTNSATAPETGSGVSQSGGLPTGTVLAPIAFGELIDKISILEIKRDRISDPRKNANVRRELDVLNAALSAFTMSSGLFSSLKEDLRRVNETLWDCEDEIRKHEKEKTFGAAFIDVARRIYMTNDERAVLKRKLNEIAGSAILEEKSYEAAP
jgi:hypothetical protein